MKVISAAITLVGCIVFSTAFAESHTGTGEPLPQANETGTEAPQVYGNETGTGSPNIAISFHDDLVIAQVVHGETVAVGRASVDSGYAIAPLDAFGAEGVEANWGRIELLKHCESTDVILYQTIDGVQQATWVETIAMQNC
ncbi:MAG: hypothetical protein MI750_07075 [Xanthomonadales bacterium]|nr:hypothetical protein [Xanthomonadales bacterium]